MVRLLELPPELLASVVAMCDAAALGRLAQSSHAWQILLRERLLQMRLEEQRQREADAAELQQAFATRVAPALLEMNDMGGGRLALRVATRDTLLRASTTRFTCECCGFQGGLLAIALPTCSGIWRPLRIGQRTGCAFKIFHSTLLHGMPS